ncbi:hypothetical protein [Ancylobacter sp. G4_0304]
MMLSSLIVALMRTLHHLDRKLTDGAWQHGRYCVADEKIRRRR